MNRTALRTAALGGLAALGMLLSAPAASAQPFTVDYGISSVGVPTIAPGSSGNVDIQITNFGTGTSLPPASVVVQVSPPGRAVPCANPILGCRDVITASLGPGQSITVRRGIAIDAGAPAGATIQAIAEIDVEGDQNPVNDGRGFTLTTPRVVQVPLVEPLIGGTAALLVLAAAGGVALHRRGRAGSEARS